MNNQERRQQRMVVGWWLGVDPAELVGEPGLKDHFATIADSYDAVVASGEERQLMPDKLSDEQVKRRMLRVEKMLRGIATTAIAKEEYVGTTAINDTMKYTLTRLALLRQETDDQE